MQLTQRQKVIVVVVGIALILSLVWVFVSLRKSAPVVKTKRLKVWGVGDEKGVFDTIFRKFGLPVEYVKKDFGTYEQDLIEALARGEGPDVFMIHNSWLPRHQSKLISAPKELVSPLYVAQNFPEVVSSDFVRKNQVYALPLSINTLALFYDKDIFNGAFVSEPPRTWKEFEDLAMRLTKHDSSGVITQSGAALGGGVKSVEKAADILGLLMIQNGSRMVDSESYHSAFNIPISYDGKQNPAVDALQFYLQFSDPHSSFYTWDSSQHYSVDAFSYAPSSQKKVAMVLDYYYRIPTFLAKNKNLNFGVARIPQQDDATESSFVTYADYWGFGVSKATKDPQLAWKFVQFITAKAQAKEYLSTTKSPPASRALIDDYKDDPILSVFAHQILIAKGWIQPGYNSVSSLFSDMITNVSQGLLTPEQAVTATGKQIDDVFARTK